MSKYIQLKSKDVKELRDKLLTEQNYICPVCKLKIRENEATLDHQHMTKNETIGENGAGLVRGVLCTRCNMAEGIFLHKYIRCGVLLKDYTQFLRNLADYLDRDNLPYIHPAEEPKAEKLGKRKFNKLKKLYKQKYPRRKDLEFPKSGKITKKMKELLNEFENEFEIK